MVGYLKSGNPMLFDRLASGTDRICRWGERERHQTAKMPSDGAFLLVVEPT